MVPEALYFQTRCYFLAWLLTFGHSLSESTCIQGLSYVDARVNLEPIGAYSDDI